MAAGVLLLVGQVYALRRLCAHDCFQDVISEVGFGSSFALQEAHRGVRDCTSWQIRLARFFSVVVVSPSQSTLMFVVTWVHPWQSTV